MKALRLHFPFDKLTSKMSANVKGHFFSENAMYEKYRAQFANSAMSFIFEKNSFLGVPEGQPGSSVTVYLTRHSGLDRTCRVKFILKLGEGDAQIDSGMLDETSDSDGRSYGWLPRAKLADLVTKGTLRLVVEMISVNVVRSNSISVFFPSSVITLFIDLPWGPSSRCFVHVWEVSLTHCSCKVFDRLKVPDYERRENCSAQPFCVFVAGEFGGVARCSAQPHRMPTL